jgi:15-cis-phytoene synthase
MDDRPDRSAGERPVTATAVSYRHCEAVTRDRARNFYYGIRLLPAPRRSAMCAIYAFARRVDDIADGPASADARLAALDDTRADLHGLGAPTSDRVLIALEDAATRYPVPLAAFDDLIEGARMDVLGTRYETYDELIVYCRRVAGSIGRLSLGVLGEPETADAARRADDLGVAMQLTNILRDLREDLAAGRVYLPAEDLQSFGYGDSGSWPAAAMDGVIRLEARRAHQWFSAGRRLLPLLDRSGAACVGAMAGIYEQLLRQIECEPQVVLERRVSVPVWAKLVIAGRALVGRPR